MCLRIISTFLCLLFSFASGGCSRAAQTPETVARTFLDRYFVELDQKAALPLTEGVAHAKIEAELRILGEDSANDDERPRIYYRQLLRKEQPDGVALRFRLTVMVPGDATVEPEVLLRLRSQDGVWRVSNFELLPMGPPSVEDQHVS